MWDADEKLREASKRLGVSESVLLAAARELWAYDRDYDDSADMVVSIVEAVLGRKSIGNQADEQLRRQVVQLQEVVIKLQQRVFKLQTEIFELKQAQANKETFKQP